MRKRVKALLDKARESAMLAVNIYNSPGTVFRSSAFIVLMNIAWTSLMHAIFERDKIKYFYKDSRDKRKYIIIDGDRKAWELSTCAEYYFKDKNNPVFQNIRFFIGLRNKIEHRFIPQIDHYIFGECQAYLMNFEEILVKEFGEKFSLADSVLFALQYSKFRSKEQIQALKKVQSRYFESVKKYIDDFRRDLDNMILSNPSYSFRVFLIQKPANHQNSADVAMEFIKFDPTNPEEMKKYEHLVTLIKEKTIPSEKVVVSHDQSDAKAKIVLVDRGITGEGPVVGVTKDLSKANGVLVVEKLSDDIFNDASGILDAAIILNKRFGEFTLPDRVWSFVYASRKIINSKEAIELLLNGSYKAYMPFCHWLTKLSPDTIINFIESAFNNVSYPRVRALIRIFVACEKEKWISYVAKKADKYKHWTQKPEWYWAFYRFIDASKQSSGLYSGLEASVNQKLFEYPIKEIIKNSELGEQLLSRVCLDFANGADIDKVLLRRLDLAVYVNRLKESLPDPE